MATVLEEEEEERERQLSNDVVVVKNVRFDMNIKYIEPRPVEAEAPPRLGVRFLGSTTQYPDKSPPPQSLPYGQKKSWQNLLLPFSMYNEPWATGAQEHYPTKPVRGYPRDHTTLEDRENVYAAPQIPKIDPTTGMYPPTISYRENPPYNDNLPGPKDAEEHRKGEDDPFSVPPVHEVSKSHRPTGSMIWTEKLVGDVVLPKECREVMPAVLASGSANGAGTGGGEVYEMTRRPWPSGKMERKEFFEDKVDGVLYSEEYTDQPPRRQG